MATKKPSAEWTGVIEVMLSPGESLINLDCRLFSAKGRPSPLPLRQVHVDCATAIREKDVPDDEVGESEKTYEHGAVETRLQPFCAKCSRYLKSDEISRAIETSVGPIQITEEDAESLKFKGLKTVMADLISAEDPAIEAVGVDRRFIVLSKPDSQKAYGMLFTVLLESKTLAFIPTIVIKGKPRVAILRPLTIPEVIFGGVRKLLVLDALSDTGALKDPARFSDYQSEFTPVDQQTAKMAVAAAQKSAGRLNPERCIDPKRQKAAEIAKRAVARSVGR